MSVSQKILKKPSVEPVLIPRQPIAAYGSLWQPTAAYSSPEEEHKWEPTYSPFSTLLCARQ